MDSIKKCRNSNLEILRIISMLLIVASHYGLHGFKTIEMTYSLNRYIVGALSLGGKVGVSCFILISGYFIVNSKFTIRKLIKLLGEVWFYSVGIGLLFLFVLTPVDPISWKDIIKMFVPVGYTQYWFVTDYIMIMLLSPVLNLTISIIPKKMYEKLLIILTLLWSISPSLISATYGYTDLGWLIVLYFFAAYIKKYINTDNCNSYKHFVIAVISYSLIVLSSVCFIYLGDITNIDLFKNNIGRFSAQNSPLVLITSIELLIAFLKIKPKSNRIINLLASAAFGIYLIHDNNIVRHYLWIKVLRNPEFYFSKYLILHAIFSIAVVYCVCTLIDILRQYTIERIFLKIVDKYLKSIEDKVYNLIENIKSRGLPLMEDDYAGHSGRKV